MPVHHDRDYANAQGAPNIFMNILTDTGYCSRFLTDWAGPEAMVKRLAIRLGAPVFPGSTLTYTGTRDRQVAPVDGEGLVEVAFRAVDRPGRPPVAARRCSAFPSRGRAVSRSLGEPGRHRRHRSDGVLQGVGAQRAAARLRGGEGRARRRRARPRPTSTAWSPSRMDASEEIEVARNLGIPDLSFFSRASPTAAGRRRAR